MPLDHGKSKEAFTHNLKAEMKAGKPMKQGLAIAYSIKNRSKKMAKGGMAHCAHGGPAYCNVGCYDAGGQVGKEAVEKEAPLSEKIKKDLRTVNGEDQLNGLFSEKMAKGGLVPAEAARNAIEYEKDRDEVMDEAPNKPRFEMPMSMSSKESIDEGDMESEDEPMKMAKGGMMHPKRMAKAIMMAKGGMVNSEDAMKAGLARTMAIEDHSGGGMDNEDIDLAWTTPHDDNLSSEGEYPLMEEEGYEEGHQAKMRRKGGLLERVMAKIHSR